MRTSPDLLSQQATRELLCKSLQGAAALTDASSEVVSSTATQVALLFEDVTQMTNASMLTCTTALTNLVVEYPQLAAVDGTINQVVTALSSILEAGSSLPGPLLSQVMQAITSLSIGRQSTLALGESGTAFATRNLRL
jgi:hypothetical protein